jgi:HSP20 family protein
VEKGTWHRREREQGDFARMVELPQPVDAEKVQAELVNGVLTVVLPKRAEAKPRRIHVKSE